jgi:hypothetical protein
MTTTRTQHEAIQAIEELAQDFDAALSLLEDFCDRFYRVRDRDDFSRPLNPLPTGMLD